MARSEHTQEVCSSVAPQQIWCSYFPITCFLYRKENFPEASRGTSSFSWETEASWLQENLLEAVESSGSSLWSEPDLSGSMLNLLSAGKCWNDLALSKNSSLCWQTATDSCEKPFFQPTGIWSRNPQPVQIFSTRKHVPKAGIDHHENTTVSHALQNRAWASRLNRAAKPVHVFAPWEDNLTFFYLKWLQNRVFWTCSSADLLHQVPAWLPAIIDTVLSVVEHSYNLSG